MDLKKKKTTLICLILAMTSRESAKPYFLPVFLTGSHVLVRKYSWSVWNRACSYRLRNVHRKCRISYVIPFLMDWCLSDLLLEEKTRNRGPMVFPGNWFSFFIVFLLSDLVLLLLLVKFICSDLIPGGCREQCGTFMPLATF